MDITCSKSKLYDLDSDKVRKHDKRDADADEKNSVGCEVGKDHEKQATDEWNYCPLLFAVHEVAEPN